MDMRIFCYLGDVIEPGKLNAENICVSSYSHFSFFYFLFHILNLIVS